MQAKKQYQKPQIKEWGSVADLTQSGIIEALFGSGKGSSSEGSGAGTVSEGGSPIKTTSSII